jgi:hypothetical protein
MRQHQQQTQHSHHHHNHHPQGGKIQGSNSIFITNPSTKFRAPYNTTQYIMHDYSRRMPALKDLQCPSEQQQFSNDWNMALLLEQLPANQQQSEVNFDLLRSGLGTNDIEMSEGNNNKNGLTKSNSESDLFSTDQQQHNIRKNLTQNQQQEQQSSSQDLFSTSI